MLCALCAVIKSDRPAHGRVRTDQDFRDRGNDLCGDPLAAIDRVANRKNRRMVVKNGVPARIRTDTAEHEAHSPADNVLRFASAANTAF